MSYENAVEIHRVYGPSAEKETLEVWRDNSINGQKVYTGNGLGKTYQEVVNAYCWSESDYVFTMTSTESNGWSEGSYFYVLVNDIEYLRGTLTDLPHKELTLSLRYLLPAQSNWRYNNQAQTTESWIHNEPYWTSYNVGQFPMISTTRYYARAVTIQEFMKTMPVVEIDIFTHEGFIAYANGVEIARFNLPASGVNHQTTCLTPLTTGVWKRIRLSGKSYLQGKSSFYLAVEVHPSATGTPDDFKAVIMPALMNEVNRLVDVTVESSIEPTSGTSVNNVVDGLSSTYLSATVPKGQELILTFTLNNDRREWFNRYSIQASASNAAADPQEWKLMGSVDGLIWKQLDYRSNEFFSTRREVKTYDLFGNTNSFNLIRLHLISRLDEDEATMRIGDVRLYVTADTTSNVKLEYAPKPNYYVDVDDYLDLYPTFSGYMDFTISPPLPDGLNITAANGRIFGSISESVVNTTTYNITAKYSYTDIYESFMLTLSIQQCNLQTMSLFEIRKYNVEDSADDQVIIIQGGVQKGNFYGENKVSTTLHRYCMDRGNYELKLSRASSTGWTHGSFVELYLYYEAGKRMFIGKTSLRDVEAVTIPFTTILALPKTDANKWYVHTSTVNTIPTNWYQSPPDTASPDWTGYDLVDGKGPEMQKNVWFIKRSVYVDNVQNDIQSYELGVYCRAGLVVYVNGNEVYRVNVDAGEIAATSTIAGGSASSYWHRIVGLRTTWNNGLNTLALAVVNTPFTGNMTLDTNVRLYFSRSSGDIPRTLNINPEASETETGYPLSNLFDGDYTTRVIMERAAVNTTEQYWGFHFMDESAELINKYCFINNDFANRYDPIAWDVYASEYGFGATSSWTLLSSVTNMQWQSRGQRACFTLPAVQKPYRFYRFLLRENTNQLPDNFYSLADIELYSIFIQNIQDYDLLYNPNSVMANFGTPMSSMQPTYTGFTQCSVNPELPAGIVIDSNSGVVSGTPIATQMMTTYTVSCTNERGTQRTATVTITVEECVAPKKPFSIVVPNVGTNGKNMKLLINGQAGTSTINSFTNYNSHYYSVCSDYNLYSISAQLTDTVNGNTWGDRYASVRLADNRELLRISSLGKTNADSGNFLPYYSVDANTQWKYNYGMQPLENWQNNNGTDLWPSEKVEDLPSTETITQYYTTTFNVNDITKIVGIETQVRITAGIIVYLNGEQIMSLNLPRTEITNSTMASTQYATAQLRKTSMQNRNLIQPTNILAVEIHRGSSIPAKNTFLLKLLLLTDNQPRNIEGTASTNKAGAYGHAVANAFDLNANTYYGHEGICANTYVQWSYTNAANHYINSYSVVAGDTCLHMAPSSWKVEASRDGESWTLLDIQSNVVWTTTTEQKTYKFYNANYYSMFRLTVTQCQKVTSIDTDSCPDIGLRLYGVDFRVGSVDYNTVCAAADGFPAALTNTYAYGACEQNYSGYKRRYCSNGIFQTVESYCTVAAPSTLTYPQESYELVVNQEVTPIKPTVVCADCSFQVTPNLPNGLVIDASQGIITGTPLNITESNRFTVTASNVAGSSSRVIDILTTNETVHCYMDIINGWESTLVNTTAVKGCPSDDFVGNMTRLCLPGSPAIWDTIVNNCELLIPNITITNTTYSFVKNERITPIIPTVTGAGITSITVNPLLPAGLYLDPVTASISGVPTQKIASTVFTITVTNANGSATLQITIEVTAFTCTADGAWSETDSGDTAYQACPQNKEGNWYRVCSATNPPQWQNPIDECKYIKPVVTYPSTSIAMQRGQQYNLVPSTQFYITSWSIAGSLPSGLTFSNANGAITGTPNTITPLTTVTVTAQNPDKVTQVSLSISVNVYKCPADGIWPETEAGQTITKDCDNVALKEGSITRICTSSSSGATWGNPNDTCSFKAPILTYASNVIQARKGEPIQTITPTTGNQIDTMTINPTLPLGLQFHPNSGAISGTPTGDASNGAYTVTASNADKSTEVVLQIIVSVAACAQTGIWAQTERGEQAYAWCEGAAGIQTRVCGNIDDTEPQWKSIDNSGCIANPEKQKPGEGESFVRFTLQLAGVSSFDATAYAAIRRVFASNLAVNEASIFIESHSAGTFSILAAGTSLQVRIATGIDNGENMKNQIVSLGKTSLTALIRGSNVASLGTATATVVESSFEITEYSIMNSVASVLVVIVVIMGVILIAIGVFFFITRSKNSSKKSHSRMANDNRAGKRTKKASIKGSRHYDDDIEERPKKKKHHYEDEEEEERPKKKKHRYEDDEEEERPKKKKHHYEDDEEEERPKKKKHHYEDDEEEERPKKKSKKSRRYEDSE